MTIGAGQEVLDPTYGPKIYIDGGLSEPYRSVAVDHDAIAENLRRDFPELTQSDWNHDIVCVTDKMDKRLGGWTVNVLPLQEHFSARLLHGSVRAARQAFSTAVTPPPAKWAIRAGRGYEVLTVLNLSSVETDDDHDGFFGPDNPASLSNILAHEFHHTTGLLLANRLNRDRQTEVGRYYDRVARYAASIVGGGSLAFTGLIANQEIHEGGIVAPVSSAVAMTGGLALAAATMYRANKTQPLSLVAAGIDTPPPEYGQGEIKADAYALGTSSSWSGVVTI